MLEKLLNDKKVLIASLIALLLVLAAILVIALVPGKDTPPDDVVKCYHEGGSATCINKAKCQYCGEEYGELGAHTYVNGTCSVCSAKDPNAPINPGTDPGNGNEDTKPEKPVIPDNVQAGDVDLATKVWNALINNRDMFYPSDFNTGYDITNVAFSNSENAFTSYSYANKNNMVYIDKTSDGGVARQYKILKDVNSYIITYNGAKYNYTSMTPVALDLASIDKSQVVYNAATNEYVLTSNYSTSLVQNVVNYVYNNDGNPMGIFDASFHSNLTYEIKFELTSAYDLKTLSVVGKIDSGVTVCIFNYVRDVNNQTSFTFTYQQDGNSINKVVEMIRQSPSMYEISVTESIFKNLMAEPYETRFIGNIRFSDKPVDMDNAVLNVMQKAELLLENYDKIAEEYAGPYVSASLYECSKYAVYDGFYEVNIYLKEIKEELFGIPVYKYTFDYISLEADEDTCWVNISTDGKLTLDRHSAAEQKYAKVEEKYSETYACLSGCGAIVIYDYEYETYVLFEQSWADEYLYEFSDCLKTYDADIYCVGVMDANNNLVISHHSRLETLIQKYKTSTLTGATDCEAFCIYDTVSKYYLVYYVDDTLVCVGYSPVQIGCLAVAEDDKTNVRILTHICEQYEE